MIEALKAKLAPALLWAVDLFRDDTGKIPSAANRQERRARQSIARRQIHLPEARDE